MMMTRQRLSSKMGKAQRDTVDAHIPYGGSGQFLGLAARRVLAYMVRWGLDYT